LTTNWLTNAGSLYIQSYWNKQSTRWGRIQVHTKCRQYEPNPEQMKSSAIQTAQISNVHLPILTSSWKPTCMTKDLRVGWLKAPHNRNTDVNFHTYPTGIRQRARCQYKKVNLDYELLASSLECLPL